MRPGSGIAGGLEYRDSHFGNGVADLRLQSLVSIRLYQRHEIELVFPHLGDPRLFVELLGTYRSQTQVDFFGVGPGSSSDDHSNYRVDGLSAFSTVGFRPSRGLQLGGRAGYVQTRLGGGTDADLPTVEERFDSVELAGLTDAPDHFIVGAFVALDSRDDPGEPRRGGRIELQTVRYLDTGPGRYSFDELDVEALYFVPAARRWTLAFRVKTVFTRPFEGHEVPFFLLPSLGGADSLHGFENDRFRDHSALVLNQVLRYRATPSIRLELFLDAGQVAPRFDALGLDALELSYGGAVRYKLGQSVLAGLSVGLGREGTRWVFSGSFRF